MEKKDQTQSLQLYRPRIVELLLTQCMNKLTWTTDIFNIAMSLIFILR